MRDFKKYDFIRTGCNMLFGSEYANYTTVHIKHKEKGTCVDVLLDENGDTLEEPTEVTDKMRANIAIDGRHAKIVPIMIEGVKMLTVIFPKI